MWTRLIPIVGLCFIVTSQNVKSAPRSGEDGKKSAATDLYGDPLPRGAIARLGTIRLRHGSYHIQALAYSPDGKHLASAGYDGIIRLWDPVDGRPVAEFPGSMSDPIAYTLDGKMLVVGPSYGRIALLEVAAAKTRIAIDVGNGRSQFALAPDRKSMVVSRMPPESEKWIELQQWDIATGKRVWTKRLPNLAGQHAIAPAANGRSETVLFTIDGSVVKSWAADTGKPVAEFRGHTDSVSDIAVSPNGRTLASIAYDHTLRFWDAATGKLLHSLACRLLVDRVAFSPDGKTFGCRVRGAAVWDDSGTIHLWNVPTGKVLRPVKLRYAGSFAFSPDGKTLAASESCSIRLWDMTTGKEHLTRPGHIREVNSVAFSADGKTLASGGAEGAVYLWRNLNPSKPEKLAGDLRHVHNVAFAPGRSLLAGSGEIGVHLWDQKTGKVVRTRKDSYRTGRAQFFPDGKTLLVAGDWQLAWLWSIDTDKVRRFNEGRIWFSGGSLTIFETAALSPDGKSLVGTSLQGDGTVYDPETGRTRARVRIGDCGFGSSSMRFAPDSRTLVLPGENNWEEGPQILFFDVPGATVVRASSRFKGFNASAIAFSPDGGTVAVGGYDGSLVLLENSTGGTRLRFGGHLGIVNEVAFSPDGRLLATASGDGTILIWQIDRLADMKIKQGPLKQKEFKALWEELGSADGSIAYQAIIRLRQDADRSTAALVEELRPIWKQDVNQVDDLIRDLGSHVFAVRELARKQLDEIHDAAVPALQKALRGNPRLEFRRRLEVLLTRLNGPTPTLRQLRTLRAIEVMEYAATDAGKSWLKELAQKPWTTLLPRQASLAFERVRKKENRLPE